MQTHLTLETEQDEAGQSSVVLRRLGGEMMARVLVVRDAGGSMDEILRVTVGRSGSRQDLPATHVAGYHELLEDGIRFEPVFPFERKLRYLATFDVTRLLASAVSVCQTLEFSLPHDDCSEPAEVSAIYPSADCVPENILRFYVTFANAMERGHAKSEILILGPDGAPAVDVLYRAPVELWDKAGRTLTVLLDPGRLKRGVGPNRTLGPPLVAGQFYALVVGAGMTNVFGRKLGQAVTKRFHVTEAVRTSVSLSNWKLKVPRARSLDPLVLSLPTALDWAALFSALTVACRRGDRVSGRIAVEQAEQRWRFVPDEPWKVGAYDIHVDPFLEDTCGNNLIAPFDRVIRNGPASGYGAPAASMSFDIES